MLTEAGQALADEIAGLFRAPASFNVLSGVELAQLRDLLDKVIAADTRVGVVGAGVGVVAGAVAGGCCELGGGRVAARSPAGAARRWSCWNGPRERIFGWPMRG